MVAGMPSPLASVPPRALTLLSPRPPAHCSCVFSFFFSSRRRHTRFDCDWSSDVCSSDLVTPRLPPREPGVSVRPPLTDVPDRVRNKQRHPERERDPDASRNLHFAQLLPIFRCKLRSSAASSSRELTEPLPEDFRRRHACADALELFHGHAVEAILAAGVLDRPHHHSPDEGRNLFHARGGRIVPRDRCRRFAAVFNQRRRLAGATKGRRRTGPVSAAKRQKRRPRERPWGVGAEWILGHEIAGHAVGPGPAPPAVAIHLARPTPPPERGAAADVSEQLR